MFLPDTALLDLQIVRLEYYSRSTCRGDSNETGDRSVILVAVDMKVGIGQTAVPRHIDPHIVYMLDPWYRAHQEIFSTCVFSGRPELNLSSGTPPSSMCSAMILVSSST